MPVKIVTLLAFLIAIGRGSDVHKAANDVDFFWRDYNGTIPSDALPAGHDTYIGQVIAPNGSNISGTLYPSSRTVVEMVSGKVFKPKTNIKVLCSKEPQRFTWKPVNGSPVFVGKVFHENEWKVGKVFPLSSEWKGLNVWTDPSSPYVADDFEVCLEVY